MTAKKGSAADSKATRKRGGRGGRSVSVSGRDPLPPGRAPSRVKTSRAARSFIRDASERLSVKPRRLEVAVAAARLKESSFSIVERIVELHQGCTNEEAERLARAARGFQEVLRDVLDLKARPLAEFVDATEEERYQALIKAEFDILGRREALLEQCIGVDQAAERIGRSRQALEKLRREGRILALRVGNRWRYPEWQFHPDFPNGVVIGLGEVLKYLHLSPSGAAAWLVKPFGELGGKRPIELLRSGRPKPVIELAEDRGHMP